MSEKKKVTIAVITSLLLHLLFFLGFGAWLGMRPQVSAKVPEQDLPPEITLLPEPTPTPDQRLAAAPTPTPDPQLLRSENMTEAEKPPENTQFESDRDTRAASEKSGTGPRNMPTIEGKKQDHLELTDQQLSLGSSGAGAAQGRPAQNQPTLQQKQSREDSRKPTMDLAKINNPLLDPSTALPTPTPPPEKLPDDALAIERATPTPAPTPTPTPAPSPTASPSPAGGGAPPQPRPPGGGTFRPQTRASELQGGISNRGKPSIATRGTPLGRYFSQVYRAIGSRWYYYVRRDADLIGPGRVQVIFNISKDGKIDNVRVLSNTANEGLASVCIQSIVDSELPPIPDEVALTLPTGRLEMPFSFTFHP